MTKKDESEKSKWETLAEQEEEKSEASDADLVEQPEGLEYPSRQKLEDQLTVFEQQANEYKEKALRAQADVENIRRRAERDVANALKFGNEKLLVDLLPVVDSLIRGLESPEAADPHVKSMREGISLTLDLLYKTLEKHGVQLIDPKPGDAFDPSLHEALSAQKDPQAKPNTIVMVVQKGYQLNGRVLRPAMVIVAA